MDQFISLKQLAELFGVSERHLYRQKAAGKLPPPIRIGRSLRWNTEEVRQHFELSTDGSRCREKGGKS